MNNNHNTKIEEFIKSLSEEEYETLVQKIKPKTEFNNMDGLLTIDTSSTRDFSAISTIVVNSCGKVRFDHSINKKPTEMTEEGYKFHLQHIGSKYDAEWMYPFTMTNDKSAHMKMLLGDVDFSDQIDSDHEQYHYFFNMHRDNVGLPRIELTVGSVYELLLGRKRDIIKKMTLVNIKGGLNSNKMPELYFENENNLYNNDCHRMNINHIKIWRKIEDGRYK